MTSSATTTDYQGRVRAMLYGLAYGDALGATLEKLPAAEIRRRFGRVESIELEWHKANLSHEARKGRVRGNGIVTDDTLMTLCLMQVYRETGRHLDAWDMADGMVRQIAWTPRWVPELQKETMLLERLYFCEKWIFQRHQLSACDPRQGGIGNMVNCGAAMYMAPIGAVNAGNPRGAYDEAIAFASGHQESYGLEAAAVLAGAVAAAFMPGATADSVVREALKLARDGTKQAIEAVSKAVPALKGQTYETVVEAFHKIMADFSPIGDDVEHTKAKAGKLTAAYNPSRFMSIEELPMALGFIQLNGGEFYKSIEDGVNSGRDTDSIGVMTGAILGALHGANVIREDACRVLDEKNRFNLLAEADSFAEVARAIQAEDALWMAEVQRRREALHSRFLSTCYSGKGPQMQPGSIRAMNDLRSDE